MNKKLGIKNWDFGVSFVMKTFYCSIRLYKFDQLNVCINYVILRHWSSEPGRILLSYPIIKFSDEAQR